MELTILVLRVLLINFRLVCSLLLAQFEVVSEYVEAIVFIVWLQQLVITLLQIAIVFGDHANGWADDEKDVVEDDMHRVGVLGKD